MNKKITAIVLLMVAFIGLKAQNIGINPTGTLPNNSAGLDVDFTNRGLLIPRIALTSSSDAVTIGSPATSLLVYNTGTGGLAPAGYYYNSGTPAAPVWIQLLTSSAMSGTAWMLLGNGGTTPGTHFVGTTDAKDLVFKTNSVEKMRILTGGNVGIGTATPANKLGVVGGNISWGNLSEVSLLQNDQGGSIELAGQNGLANPNAGGSPYIDFHFGTGAAQDYNTRIINAANNRLDIATNTGGIVSLNNTNFGVGTTTPAQRLDVSGNVQFSGALMPAGIAGTTGQILTSQGAGLPPIWTAPASISVYGNNAQSVKLTTMINTTSGSLVNMPGMTVVMTPTHSTVFIFASVAGRLTDNTGMAQFGQADMYIAVLVNGVQQAITKCIITDYDDVNGVVAGGSAAVSGVPVTVVPGSPITVQLQWYIVRLWSSSPWQLRCDPTLVNLGDHAVLTVFD